jgi:glyceraldehyde-3-phosphate dehydrogenase (NAD(P))
MGGAHRSDLLKELSKRHWNTKLEWFWKRVFFSALRTTRDSSTHSKAHSVHERNTTALCRTVKAAQPLGLKAVLGNLDRRIGDPHNIVKMSPNAIQFGCGPRHPGKDAGTIFKSVSFSVRASKVPITLPHVYQMNLIFEASPLSRCCWNSYLIQEG